MKDENDFDAVQSIFCMIVNAWCKLTFVDTIFVYVIVHRSDVF